MEPTKLFDLIGSLVMCHSPSGAEQEIDDFLVEQFRMIGIQASQDAAGNIIAKLAGRERGAIAITAHKDEIGASVATIDDDGKLKLRALGGSHPWIYGEGVVDILGDQDLISGILSFGSRHVSHASPQFSQMESAPVHWEDAWVETKLSRERLNNAGIRPGTPIVVGKHRKSPWRMNGHIASYALDNKASLAILLLLASTVKRPKQDIYLVATTKEEVGASGGQYFAHHHNVDAMIALEIAPISREYPINDSDLPVLLTSDTFTVYDDGLNQQIRRAAQAIGLDVQLAGLNRFGSDASLALRSGHVPRAACLSFPTENTHGFEIAKLETVTNCVRILAELISTGLPYASIDGRHDR